MRAELDRAEPWQPDQILMGCVQACWHPAILHPKPELAAVGIGEAGQRFHQLVIIELCGRS